MKELIQERLSQGSSVEVEEWVKEQGTGQRLARRRVKFT